MRFAHVIFDCDGVLLDSERTNIGIAREICAEFGAALTDEEARDIFTGNSAEWQGHWLSAAIGREVTEAFERQHAERIHAAFARGIEAVPHVRQALASIPQPKSVATNGIRERATFGLTQAGLIGFFDRLNAVEDVANPKPAPDLYLLAAKRAGFAPDQCAVIEDSATGVRAARGAGMSVVGFIGVCHDPEAARQDLIRAGAHVILEDMRALHTTLDWL